MTLGISQVTPHPSIGNGIEGCPVLVGPDGIFYSALWECDVFDCAKHKTKLGLLGLPLDTQPRQDMENLVHDLVRAQHAHSIQAGQRPGFLPVCAAGETAAWQCVS